MPITVSFLFLYSFFSLVAFMVGVYARSPVVIVVSGLMLMFVGTLGAAVGHVEYIESMNLTYVYTLGNLTSSTQEQNYIVVNDLVSKGTSMILAMCGVGMIVYGASIYGEVRKPS